jgi:hypothetical protein
MALPSDLDIFSTPSVPCALEEAKGKRDLRLLAERALDLPCHQEVHVLIRPSDLDIRLERDGVVRLDQRIEQLVEGDGDLVSQPRSEVVPLEEACDRRVRAEADEIADVHAFHPLAVEPDLGAVHVENPAHLLPVGLGVPVDLLPGEGRACSTPAGRVPDPSGEISDQEDDLVTQILKRPEPIERNQMADVKIGARGIAAVLDP